MATEHSAGEGEQRRSLEHVPEVGSVSRGREEAAEQPQYRRERSVIRLSLRGDEWNLSIYFPIFHSLVVHRVIASGCTP